MLKNNHIIALIISVSLVVLLFACASTRKQESTGEYIDDSMITSNVKAAILAESSLTSFQISVETFKGIVQLSGFVDSAEKVAKAGEVSAKVDNVKSVVNNLIVK